MLAVCAECGSALIERRDLRTGLPYPGCERDASHGRRSPSRAQAHEHRPSKGRWLRAARRALGTLTG